MAAVGKNLGDFFASKKKKKIKAVNLNPQTEEDAEKPKKKDKEEKKDGEWDETENKEQPAPKAELGILAKEEEEETEQQRPARAWATAKAAVPASAASTKLNDPKKFPTLAASTTGRPIATMVQEGADPFAKGKKNQFAGLDTGSDSDEEKPARQHLANKKRGEQDLGAIAPVADVPLDKEALQRKEAKMKKKDEKNEKRAELKAARLEANVNGTEVSEQDLPDDCLIPMDVEAARKKYEGRRKLPVADLSFSELKEEKTQRKKLKVMKVEDKPKKNNVLVYEDDAW